MTSRPSHGPKAKTVSAVMARVLVALIPAIGLHAYFFGPGILFQIGLSVGFAVALEAGMLSLRHQPLKPFLSDYSAVVCGVLFALCLPAMAPWWVSLVGMVFAIVIAKQLYGGLGFNIFNPAMVGFAAVIIAFPEPLTRWIIPSVVNDARPGWNVTIQTIFTGQLPDASAWDTLSQATPLDQLRSGRLDGMTISEITQDPSFGWMGSAGWEWIALAYLLGGFYLIHQRVITWHVPATVILTTIALSMPGWLLDPDTFRSPMQQLMAGSLMMCAFFIATDPVSGARTPRGKIVFSIGIVMLTLAIRAWGGFPDGVAFAVLLMNMCAPLIDRFTRPRIFGHTKARPRP